MEFNFTQSPDVLKAQNIDLLIQVFLLLLVLFYSGFNLLVYKQVGILNQSIQTTRAPLLKRLAKANLVASALLVVVLILLIIF